MRRAVTLAVTLATLVRTSDAVTSRAACADALESLERAMRAESLGADDAPIRRPGRMRLVAHGRSERAIERAIDAFLEGVGEGATADARRAIVEEEREAIENYVFARGAEGVAAATCARRAREGEREGEL